jgi:hypothetical protein
VIEDLEEHAYGSASWIENLNKGLKKANEIKRKIDKKPPKESDEDFRKKLEEFDKDKDAPTEAWGADELNGDGLFDDIKEGMKQREKDALAKWNKMSPQEKLRYEIQENIATLGEERAKWFNKSLYEKLAKLEGGAAPKAEPKPPSGVAVAAEALKPVREAIQNGIGDALYGKSDDPKKQKKGLLGISEEGKEESKKKVMKNIVVPIVKTATALGKNVKDIANKIFNPDQYDADMKEERIKEIKRDEAKAGIVRDKENPMIIIRKPAGLWTAETTDPTEEAYYTKRIASRKPEDVFYVRVPNPIFAAKLRPSFQELGKAGFVKQVGNERQLDLWTGVNQFEKNEDIDGTLKSLHDDEFIWLPENRAKDIYGKLRQFVQSKEDAKEVAGFEDTGITKGFMKQIASIDPRTLKGQDLIDYKQSKLRIDDATASASLKKVDKDIKDEMAKATPDQARLTKMREARERVIKRQQELAKRGQTEFQEAMAYLAPIAKEKARKREEDFKREREEAQKQDQADQAEFQAKPVAEKIAILEELKRQMEEQTGVGGFPDYDEQIEQLRAQEASEKVEEQAQGSVDLLQQAEVIGAEGGAKPCWKGYEMIGMKQKGKRTVPNCVPIGGEGGDDDDDDDDDESVEDIDIIRIDMGKGLVYLVDAPTKNAKGKLVGLPFSSLKEALSSPLGIGNRRVFDAETEEEVGRLKDPIYKKLAMKVFNMEKEWRAENLKKLGFAMDEDEDELEGAGAKPVEMKQSDYYKEHQNIVKLLKNTGKSLLSEAKDQQEEATAMAKKMDAPDPFDGEMEGAGAVEWTLQKAGKSLFNPSGDMTKAGRQSFTPDYDAYGETVEEGRKNAFNLSRSMYDQSKAIELPDFKLIQDDTSLRFYRKNDENVFLVGIRGTDVKSWTDLYTWAVIGANQDLRMTTRFQEDLAKMVAFQRNYPPSQFYYVATGSSLAGSIADRFLELGLIEEAITYNPSIERKYVLDESILNHRIYLDTDPLFMLMGQYAPNTEIRVNPNKTNFYNPSKEKDYLIASHSIYPIYNPAFEGGGMEGSGKTYTLEEWKAIFDAKLEEKRKAIEAREAKKKQTAKAKRARAKARREEREKPKEPEPAPEEEEPEVEVAEYEMGDEIYLVEEPREGLAFAERRVFDNDGETLGNLTEDDVGKTLVKMVMRREKIGAFADKSPKAKSSSESLPFFESQQPKAKEKKKKEPKAPASARVELREELVAEQPRNPAGEFAVAIAQPRPRPMTGLPRMTAKQKEFFMNLLSRNMSATQKSILLARSGMSDRLIERLLPFMTPTNRREVMKQTGLITEKVAEKRNDTDYPYLPADIKTGLRKLAQDIMNMKGRRPTMLDDARRTDTLRKMTETEKRQMLRRNFVAGVKSCEAIVSMTRTDMFGDYSCRRWEEGQPSYFKRVETSEYGVKGKCMAIGDEAGIPQGATLDQLKRVVGVGRDSAMMSSRMLCELSPSTWGVEDKPEAKFLSKGVPITKSTPDTDLAEYIRETQKIWRMCILKMLKSCGIDASIQKKINQSWKRGYGVVIFWDALQGDKNLTKVKVREAQQEVDEKLSSPKLKEFLLDLRGFCAMVAEETEAEEEGEVAQRRKDEAEKIYMRQLESEITPDEEEERAKVRANPELKEKLWKAIGEDTRRLNLAFDTAPFSGDLRRRLNRMKRIAGIDYNIGYGSVVPANFWVSGLKAKLPPIRKKEGYYPSAEEYIRDMEKR